MSRPVPPASEYNSYITAGDNFPDRGGGLERENDSSIAVSAVKVRVFKHLEEH